MLTKQRALLTEVIEINGDTYSNNVSNTRELTMSTSFTDGCVDDGDHTPLV